MGRSGWDSLLYWYLNDRQPFLGVFLIPGSVDVTGTVLTDGLQTVLLDVAEGLGERLVEAFVGANVLHAEGTGHGGQALELDDGAVFAHLLHLFTILDVDVRRCVLLVVLHGEAVARRRTLAAEALHFGTDLLDTQWTDGGEVGDDFTMACHDDFGQ